jgi:DNA helicase-2/ATP-dependent DNA helicase PcrA
LEICLNVHEDVIFIPAHIWTPWFSLFGSKSGFDCIEDCFADLSGHITALETGLSSDPAMNWRLSALDRYTLVSNSDAHSLDTIAREANLLNCAPTFPSLRSALQGSPSFIGTLEFFPDEGKYHLDGHRECGICLTPQETRELKGLCPHCGKPVTVGVLNRVQELADREFGYVPPQAPQVESLTSLNQTLAQSLGKGAASKSVQQLKQTLLHNVGNELYILRHWPLPEAEKSTPLLGEALMRLRTGKVILTPGFDGQFGSVELFTEQERESIKGQLRLLNVSAAVHKHERLPATPIQFTMADTPSAIINAGLDTEQQAAINYANGNLQISAGPGSGKTRLLVERAKKLLADGVKNILVITFTRKAAAELRNRLGDGPITVSTFHGLGHQLLNHAHNIIDQDERLTLIKNLSSPASDYLQLADAVSLLKQSGEASAEVRTLARQYDQRLRQKNAFDLDDLVYQTVLRLREQSLSAPHFDHILVDEYQDVNPMQVNLLQMLSAAGKCGLTVIGDPRQAIYGFRGARRELFYQFSKDFAPARHMELFRNYRSQGAIVKLAGNLLSAEENNLRAVLPIAETTVAATLSSPWAEADWLAAQIIKLTGGMDSRQAEKQINANRLYAPNEIAVIYRLHQQGQIIQQTLEQHGIPVQKAKDKHLQELDELDFNTQKVSLLSMHASKGLEFPVVMLCGLEAGLIPYQPPGATEIDPQQEMEEERLLFVALTRAQERLFISRCRQRMLFGRYLPEQDSPLWQKLQGPWLRISNSKGAMKNKPRQGNLF